MGMLLVILSCGPPTDPHDCLKRCHGCEPSCVTDHSGLTTGHDQECDEECNIGDDQWFCEVEAGECAVMVF